VHALKGGFKVLSFNTAALLDEFHANRSSFQLGKFYSHLREVPLLLLDDSGEMLRNEMVGQQVQESGSE